MAVQFFEDSGIAILEEARTIVTTETPQQSPVGERTSVAVLGEKSTAYIMGWGANNDLPAMRERVVADNNIVPSLLATRRDITIGRGIMTYRERYEDDGTGVTKRVIDEIPMPTEMEEVFDRLDIDTYLNHAARNLVFHAMVFPEFTRNMKGEIISMRSLEARHIRSEYQDENGKVKNWYWSGQWGHNEYVSGAPNGNTRNTRSTNVTNRPIIATRIPVYNPELRQKKFIYPVGDDLLCIDEYYNTPYWWGSEEWIRLANLIPAFHQANLDHGYSIRYHIEIPKGYFANATSVAQTPELRKSAEEAENTAKQDFLDKLNKFLAGVKKAGRAVVTEYEINKALGKDFPGIKITPLKVDLQDEALLKLFEKSNQANISAQGVHPTLANIETAGKLSSGSEMRNAFLMYVAVKTPLPRNILLKPLKILQREFGWDKTIKFGFRDMEITTLDNNPKGSQETVNTPT